MAIIQSTSSFSYGFTYDVFLSFRGTDTRYGFTGNLYRALFEGGVHTFIDDRELHAGDEITQSLVTAIEESRIFIPVFSVKYASSSFCLDELVHIMKCNKTKGCLVLPIFYDVEPTHVRHQTGSYGEAISNHIERFQNNKEKYDDNMERLHNWKIALNQAANLSGHHFNPRNEYEYQFTQELVKYVSNKISRVPLHIADYPVGMQRRMLKVNSLLKVRSNNEFNMLGIYGPGGLGKTTLAKAIYNIIADQFECLCFLHNVKEKSAKHGLEHLQKHFLSKTIGLDIQIEDSSEGIPIIRKRLHRKKVLLILDDIDELKQLQALAGGLDWFGVGSRVIVTTRDKHLLENHGIEVIYEIDEFDKGEALEFLRWQAFKSKQVDSSYENILNRAVNYASGFPLALEVLGSNLFGKPVEEWNSLLDQYEKIPNRKIQKILKVSFDALEEEEQSVFLDIACCFKGYDLKEVEDILCAHYGREMKYHIGVLVEKSLVKIIKHTFHNKPDYVILHDLIEDMGKEIVRQESPNEPGKRSRLWFHEDIFQVLEKNSGTSQIKIIHLNFPLSEEIVEWTGDELKKMENLKTLVVKTSFYLKPKVHFPNSLRVLEWPSLQEIPSDFHPKNFLICKLPNNGLASFNLDNSLNRMVFLSLKVLRLDYSDSLIQISDLSDLRNLEEFSFQNCENLLTIHDSVGFLNKLKILNAEGCEKLRSFPPIQLPSLQKLQLSYCNRLKNFPEILGKMENIEIIYLCDTCIEELPDSFQNLTGLENLALGGGQILLRLPSSILMMQKLSSISVQNYHLLPKQCDKPNSMECSNVQSITLENCNLNDESLPIALKWFSNVRNLILSWNNFTILPLCIKEHGSLASLILDDCKFLQEIRGIPPNLKELSLENCDSLSSSCRSMLLKQELHEGGGTMFCLPGTELIPEWFEYDYRELSFSFWFRKKLPSIALFFTTAEWVNKNTFDEDHFDISFLKLIINGCKCTLNSWMGFRIQLYHTYLFDLKLHDMVKLDEVIFKHEWNHAKLTYEDSEMKSILKECRLHIFEQESSMEDFQFTNPYKKRELYDGIDNVNGDIFHDVDHVFEDDGDVFHDVNDVLEDDVDEENDDDDNHHSQ
ncbi:TMV resistance protein N [Trifolium repens]|nr:TMV resistance protein N [Trifolium repens]